MTESLRRALFVEGQDDLHALRHLLLRRGVQLDDITMEKRGGATGMLSAIAPEVRARTGRVIGFVIDANDQPTDRWRAVANRLRQVRVDGDGEPPSEHGFIGESAYYGTRVGVWLMPDNLRPGAIENFLRDLIASDDTLFGLATEATRRARELGASFKRGDRRKAELHSWLAWQKEPGRPYGTAIKARYFGDASPAADRFLDWFCELFGVDPDLLDNTTP